MHVAVLQTFTLTTTSRCTEIESRRLLALWTVADLALVPKSQTTEKCPRNSQEAEVEGIGRTAL